MIALPLVSIIIPLYNAEKYVAEAIESVINQTYTNWELIIVNDGSIDNSLAIAKSFENEKIKVFSQENKGASAARNFGYSLSKGDFIKFFDADDLLSQNMLEEQVNRLKDNENCIASAQWGRFYKNDIATFKLSPEECWQDMKPIDWISSSWKNGTSMTQPGIFLIQRNIIEKAGLWDETLTLIDDLEYFSKTILASTKILFCDNATLHYRSGIPNNLSGLKSRLAMESCFKSIDLSTGYLLHASMSKEAKQSASNLLQSLVFESYPDNLDLVDKANLRLKKLPPPLIKYPASGISRIILTFLGWKVLKKIRKYYEH